MIVLGVDNYDSRPLVDARSMDSTGRKTAQVCNSLIVMRLCGWREESRRRRQEDDHKGAVDGNLCTGLLVCTDLCV